MFKIKIRVARATLLATSAGTIVAGLLAVLPAAASALTANQKSEAVLACIAAGGSHRDCCHLVGGTYRVEYDENGNIIDESCLVSADPRVDPEAQGVGGGRGLTQQGPPTESTCPPNTISSCTSGGSTQPAQSTAT